MELIQTLTKDIEPGSVSYSKNFKNIRRRFTVWTEGKIKQKLEAELRWHGKNNVTYAVVKDCKSLEDVIEIYPEEFI